MKRAIWFGILFTAFLSNSHAIVGYINRPFEAGDNLFQNNLGNGDLSGNHLSVIFNNSAVPTGTTVSLWNPTTLSYDTSSTWNGSAWSVDLQLFPGMGAKLSTSTVFTNTFVGEVWNRTGAPADLEDLEIFPPAFSGTGVYLMGDIMPVSGENVFMRVLGREPKNGEQFIRLNEATQTYITSTFNSATGWDIVPSLDYCESAFFNLSGKTFAVPEPSILGLGFVGFTLLVIRRKR